MNGSRRMVFAVTGLAVLIGVCRAQDTPNVGTQSSSSQTATQTYPAIYVVRDNYRGPFSTAGIALKITSLGPGFDIATPLARKVNLRGSGNFFDYGQTFNIDGVNYTAELHFNSGQVNLDWFPFGGAFHISPGMLIYKNDLSAGANVPGGSTLTLGNQQYTSSSTDPAHGNAALTFPHTISPSLLLGFGNIIPRSNKHWSVPFEFGAAYVGQTTVNINLAGTVCTTVGVTISCVNAATDPTTQANLKDEENTLNEDLKRVQVYPLISLGVSYKF